MQAKKLFISALALLAGLTLSAQEKKKSEEVTFVVNMFCENCKAKIERNISWENGVKDLTADLEKKTVKIVYNPQKTTEEKLKKEIKKLGFTCEKQNMP